MWVDRGVAAGKDGGRGICGLIGGVAAGKDGGRGICGLIGGVALGKAINERLHVFSCME